MNQNHQRGFSRRAFLGGAGVMVALPFLESLYGRTAYGAPTPAKRLLFYYVPNGIHMASYTPKGVGDTWELSPILQPLAMHKADVLVLSGIDNKPARPDGPGDHAGGTSAFLTCSHVNKSDSDIRNAISVDQVAVQKLGTQTRLPSLQLGLEGGASAGGCDSGYSCAYTRNISWAGPKTPLPKTVSPQVAFDLFFKGLDDGATKEQTERRKRYQKSVLDLVRTDASSLRGKLGKTDQQKLDEYLTSVREVESRLSSAQMCELSKRPDANIAFQDQVRIMSDLMVLAFQCDLTRVISFMLGNGGSGRSYSFLGVSGGHHEISHHMNLQENYDKLIKIGTWEIQQLAYLIGKMKSIKEGDGTLLDNSLVYFSSEIEDGNAHRHTNLPIVMAGKLGGTIRPGRHLMYQGQPLANLFVSILRAVGQQVDRFGDDSTGALAGLG